MKSRSIILVIFIAASILRIVNISSDAPSDLSPSAGIYVDEVHNIHEVRNKILFGRWDMDRYPSTAYSPIFAYLQYIILSVIGIGLWQIKVLPVILSIISLIIIYKAYKEYFGDNYAVVALTLTGFNYVLIMYNRLGLYENLVILFMVLTFFFWQRAVRSMNLLYAFLTGLCTFCVFISKNIALYFVITSVLTIILYGIGRGFKKSYGVISVYALGIVFGVAVWYLGYYLPFRQDITRLGSQWIRLSADIADIIRSLLSFDTIFLRLRSMPVSFAAALVFLNVLIYKFLRFRGKADPVELFLALWFICGFLFMQILTHRPTRYMVPVVPAILLMASIAVTRFAIREKVNVFLKKDIVLYLTVFLGMGGLSIYFILPYIVKFRPLWAEAIRIKDVSLGDLLLISAALAVAATAFVYLLRTMFWRSKGDIRAEFVGKDKRQIISELIVIAILLVNMSFYLGWALNPSYSIRDTSRDVARLVAEGSIIAGQGVMAATIENRLRHLQAPNWYEDSKRLFKDYDITHLFLSHYCGYLGWYRRHYPEVMKNSREISRYRIGRIEFRLIEIDVPDGKKKDAYRYKG